MEKRTRVAWAALLALVAGAVGCGQKLDVEKTVTLSPGENEIYPLLIDAPRRDQNVKVEVSSPGVPVSAWVVLEDDRAAVVQKLEKGGQPEKNHVRAGKERSPTIELETLIPAGKAFAVVVAGASKKTDVKVKVTGR